MSFIRGGIIAAIALLCFGWDFTNWQFWLWIVGWAIIVETR
jgi:hypothetical protein